LATLANPPGWANGGAGGNTYPAGHEQEYFNFCSRVASRYRTRNTIEAYMIWNEPQGYGVTSAQYKTLLIGGSNAIRAVDTSKRILFNTNGIPGDAALLSWFPPLISDAAVRNAVDVLSFHSYPRPAAPELGNFVRNNVGPLDVRLGKMQNILSTNGWTGEVWITEGGWATNAPKLDTIVSWADQARFLIRQTIILMEKVDRYYMFQLYGGADNVVVTDEAGGMGMVLDTLAPKLSFGAWKYLCHKPISGLTRVAATLPLWRYQHSTGHIFWTVSGTANVTLTNLPDTVYKTTLFGVTTSVNTTGGSLTVTAGIDPIYIDTVAP